MTHHSVSEEEKLKINDHQEWHGRHKGISFRIVKWKGNLPPEYDMGYHWNYYIFVKPRRLKTYKGITDARRVDYSKMYADVWMAGGITYWGRYKSSSLFEADEIGCDYGHIWDMEEGGRRFRERDVEEIKRDVIKTIDELPEDLSTRPE